MKRHFASALILALFTLAAFLCVFFAACATTPNDTFKQMELGLNTLVGRNESVAFAVLGYPSGQQTFGSDHVYYWEVRPYTYIPQKRTPSGNPVLDAMIEADEMNAREKAAEHCLIKIGVNSSNIIINWEFKGDIGGCSRYIDKLNKFTKSIRK